ncbi:hypothetical protein [Sediminicoccus sp. KRV36]|uniref:head-tail joining protein n=1 Tax=Sediminicoccus sp. KRV36 TaxID=3133721 RepID=UPI00200FA077|nr:hypothetical protein [Sediminicoccus rosea]UPY37215.1 hypothetical protein LHU95_00545 [Sediminicoccus rosea]
MNAFAEALAVLHADPNLGEDAVYLPPGNGAPVPCRVLRRQPDPVLDLGQHHVRQAGWVFEIQVAEVASPEKGGQLQLAAGAREIFDVQLDEAMLSHRVSVR